MGLVLVLVLALDLDLVKDALLGHIFAHDMEAVDPTMVTRTVTELPRNLLRSLLDLLRPILPRFLVLALLLLPGQGL
jgi:hypothetical protein